MADEAKEIQILRETNKVLADEAELWGSYEKLLADPTANPAGFKRYLNGVNQLFRAWQLDSYSEGETGMTGPDLYWVKPEQGLTRQEFERQLKEDLEMEEEKIKEVTETMFGPKEGKEALTETEIKEFNSDQLGKFLKELTGLDVVSQGSKKDQLGLDEVWKDYIGNRIKAIRQIEQPSKDRQELVGRWLQFFEAAKVEAEGGSYKHMKRLQEYLGIGRSPVDQSNWQQRAELVKKQVDKGVTREEELVREIDGYLRKPLQGGRHTEKLIREFKQSVELKGEAATPEEKQYLSFLNTRFDLQQRFPPKTFIEKIKQVFPNRWLKGENLTERLDRAAELFYWADIDPESLLTGEGAKSLDGQHIFLARNRQTWPLMQFLLTQAQERKVALVRKFVDELVAKGRIAFEVKGSDIIMANISREAGGVGPDSEGLAVQDLLDEISKAKEMQQRHKLGNIDYDWLELLARLTTANEINKQMIDDFGLYRDESRLPDVGTLVDGKTIGRLLADEGFVQIINEEVWYPQKDPLTGEISLKKYDQVIEEATRELQGKYPGFKIKAAGMFLEQASSVRASYWNLIKMKDLEDYYSRNMGILGSGLPIVELPDGWTDSEKRVGKSFLKLMSVFSLQDRSWNLMFQRSVLNPEEIEAGVRRHGVPYVTMKKWDWEKGGAILDLEESLDQDKVLEVADLAGKEVGVDAEAVLDKVKILAIRREQLKWQVFSWLTGKHGKRVIGENVFIGEEGGTRLPFGYTQKDHRERLLSFLRDEKEKGRANLEKVDFDTDFIDGGWLEATLMDIFRHEYREGEKTKELRNHLVAWVGMGLRASRQEAHDKKAEIPGKRERLRSAREEAGNGNFTVLSQMVSDHKFADKEVDVGNWQRQARELEDLFNRIEQGSEITLDDVRIAGLEAFTLGLAYLLRPENEATLRQLGLDSEAGRRWLEQLQSDPREADEATKLEQERFVRAVKLELTLEDITTFGIGSKWQRYVPADEGEKDIDSYLKEAKKETGWPGLRRLHYYQAYLEDYFKYIAKNLRGWRPQVRIPRRKGTAPRYTNIKPWEWVKEAMGHMRDTSPHDDIYFQPHFTTGYALSKLWANVAKKDIAEDPVSVTQKMVDQWLNDGMFTEAMVPVPWLIGEGVENRGEDPEGYLKSTERFLTLQKNLLRVTVSQGFFRELATLPVVTAEQAYGRLINDRMFFHAAPLLNEGLLRPMERTPYILGIIDIEDEVRNGNIQIISDERLTKDNEGNLIEVYDSRFRKVQMELIGGLLTAGSDRVFAQIHLFGWNKMQMPWDESEQPLNQGLYLWETMQNWAGLDNLTNPRVQLQSIRQQLFEAASDPFIWDTEIIDGKVQYSFVPEAWVAICERFYGFNLRDHESLVERFGENGVQEFRSRFEEAMFAYQEGVMKAVWGVDFEGLEGTPELLGVFSTYIKGVVWRILGYYGAETEFGQKPSEAPERIVIPPVELRWVDENGNQRSDSLPAIIMGSTPNPAEIAKDVAEGEDRKLVDIEIDGRIQKAVEVRYALARVYHRDPYYRELPVFSGQEYEEAAKLAFLNLPQPRSRNREEREPGTVAEQLVRKLALIAKLLDKDMVPDREAAVADEDQNMVRLVEELEQFAINIGIGREPAVLANLIYGALESEKVIDPRTNEEKVVRYRKSNLEMRGRAFEAIREFLAKPEGLRAYLKLMYFYDIGQMASEVVDGAVIERAMNLVGQERPLQMKVEDWLGAVEFMNVVPNKPEELKLITHEMVKRANWRREGLVDMVDEKWESVGILFKMKRVVQKRLYYYLTQEPVRRIKALGIGISIKLKRDILKTAIEAQDPESARMATRQLSEKIGTIKQMFELMSELAEARLGDLAKEVFTLKGKEIFIGWLEKKDVQTLRADLVPYFWSTLGERLAKRGEKGLVRVFLETFWHWREGWDGLNWKAHLWRHGRYPIWSTIFGWPFEKMGAPGVKEWIKKVWDPVRGPLAFFEFVPPTTTLVQLLSTAEAVSQNFAYLTTLEKFLQNADLVTLAKVAEGINGVLSSAGGPVLGFVIAYIPWHFGVKLVNYLAYNLIEHVVRNGGININLRDIPIQIPILNKIKIQIPIRKLFRPGGQPPDWTKGNPDYNMKNSDEFVEIEKEHKL